VHTGVSTLLYTSRLTTTDVGIMPRLAYARVTHTAPVFYRFMSPIAGLHSTKLRTKRSVKCIYRKHSNKSRVGSS